MGIEAPHQRCRQLDAPARVVVAGDHHDVQLRELFVGADDEVVEALLGLEWRVDRVEHVAGDQQGVGAVGDQLVEQPGEELRVLVVAVLAVEGLAEVPVGGVDQAHGLRLIVGGCSGEPLAWVVRRVVASDVRLVELVTVAGFGGRFGRPALSSARTTGCALHGASLFLAWPRKSNQKEGHPDIRVLLRKTSLPPALLRGPSRRDVPVPSLLARRPCLASPCAAPTLGLLKGSRVRAA